MKDKKIILDVTCSSRAMWFQKRHPNALYCDIRQIEKGSLSTAPNFEINPDVQADFRNLPFKDKSFKLVVFDPPHLLNLESNSWISLKYGDLRTGNWRETIKQGFLECMRVLEDNGVLIFKWSKTNDNRRRRDISIENVLKVISPYTPLFGHPSGSKLNTIWMVFMKLPGQSAILPGQSTLSCLSTPAGVQQNPDDQK